MTAPTIAVTCVANDQNGNPVAGAVFTARLDSTEVYQGFVVPERVQVVANASGIAVLNLWPNALGVAGSLYRVTAVNPDTGRKFLDTTISVPNSPCNLHEILVQAPYPTLDAAAQALMAAQGALALVTAQADIATAKAVLTAADVVLTHADVVATGADADATAADRIQTGLDRVDTGEDVALTHADVLTTAGHAAATAADVLTLAPINAAMTELLAVQTNLADINAVENNLTQIGAVATDVLKVNTVANNIASVNTVSGAMTNVNTTANNIGSVNAVAGSVGNVNIVATANANVNTVAGNIANVNTVAGVAPQVTTVAGNTINIDTVAGVSANVTTVAGSMANVNTVAGSIASVNSAATNMGAILTAPAQASAAASSSAAALASEIATAASAAAALANKIVSETKAGESAGSASVAAGHAASASSVVQQDLSGVNAAALHRSPNAVTAMFVYDTQKDSDGGAWTEKCQHTSWYNEAINGKWLGAWSNETNARARANADAAVVTGPELITNGSFDTDTGWTKGTGWTIANGVASYSGALSANRLVQARSGVSGKTYKVALTFTMKNTPSAAACLAIQLGGVGQDVLVYSDTGLEAGRTYTLSAIATPTAVSSYEFRIGSNANYQMDFDVDGISVKEVAAVFPTTGDYYQQTTDGKFYKLNATAGITETFRGNKRDFPRLSAIVAEAGNVTVYDLTEPGRPMWMRFGKSAAGVVGTAGKFILGSSSAAANGVACSQGRIVITQGPWSSADEGCVAIDFGADAARWYSVQAFLWSAGIANRNTSQTLLATGGPGLVSRACNAVAMTVLPDAPIDPATGLAIPTIAVATSVGLSVIQHSGAVRNSSSTTAYTKVVLDEREVGATYASGFSVSGPPGALGASFVLTNYTTTSVPALMGVPTAVA